MQLTLFSDYALRVLLYLGSHRERVVPLEEVSRAYGISRHHLEKVVQRLGEMGFVDATRGRGGGLRLGCEPDTIRIGALVRATEPHANLVECFDMETNQCPIAPACGLKGALAQAQRAFYQTLDGHTLADFLPRPDRLIPLWGAKLRESVSEPDGPRPRRRAAR